MNKVEQAVCRIREKLPDNQGFVTLGVACVVKNEELAASLGWKCPNLILTSSAVITPEHLALDRIFLAEFLVFEKKGFEVFDLKLASEFCRTVSSRALSEEEQQQLPNDRLTVISTEPLDKRGFLKRMVKKSSLQTTRPIECFNFQNFQNELFGDGIFCNVIREFGSLTQDFETRTYKFKQNEENLTYFLEDFGQQAVELEIQNFPADLQPLGGVIFSKSGVYVGCLGYGKTQIEPSFVPSSLFQVVETKEESQPEEEEEEEEQKEADLFVEGAEATEAANKEDKQPIDENKNEELDIVEKVSPEKDEDLSSPVEDKEEKTMQEEKEDDLEEQTAQQNEQDEKRTEHLSEGKETESGQEAAEKTQINESEEISTVKTVPESLETEALEHESLSKEVDEGVSETGEENVDTSKEEDGSDHEFVIAIESPENESQEDEKDISDHIETLESGNVEISEPEKENLESGDSNGQDTQMTALVDKEEVKISHEVEEQISSQGTDIEPNVAVENKEADVAMETEQHLEDSPEEEPKNEKPDISVLTDTEVKNNDDGIPQPMVTPGEVMEVRDTNDSLEAGTESSMVQNTADDMEIDQVNISNEGVEADEGKVNEVQSPMEEDNIIEVKENREEVQHGESLAPTLEEQLDIQLQKRRESIKTEELHHEERKEEHIESQPEKEEMLDKHKDISSEIIPEKDIVESSKSEEALETDKLDGPVQEVEVLQLEPTQSPRKVEDDVGESLEPDALLSTTITNNPKVLDELAILLDTEYQHGGVASWQDMALLLDIPKEAYDHCLSYSKSSPTESLMLFLSNTKPQFSISDLKDSLRSIGRLDIVHILDRYIARSIVSEESVILGVVERDDTDLLGELALKLDRSGPQNWKSLSTQLEVPRRIAKHFGTQQRQNAAILMLKYLPIFDPDLTVQSLKDACEAISKFDVVKFLDTSGVPGDDAIMDILEDTDIIDEISDMLNDDEVVPNWKDLAKELKIPEEKFSIFEPAGKKSPTKLLLKSIEQCEPDITVDELILALVAMKRHDVIDMLYKHFKRSDIRAILEENNCLPPEPQLEDEEDKEDGDDGAESFA